MPDTKQKNSTLIAYIPVLHDGYRMFFEQFPEVENLILLRREDYLEFDDLKKDARCLDVELIKKSLENWQRFTHIEILDQEKIDELCAAKTELFMPDDDLSHWLVERFFTDNSTHFAPIFLRWDKHSLNSQQAPLPNSRISNTDFDKEMMQLAYQQANKSADWWRHVGAILFKDKKVVFAEANQHLPAQQQPYFDGDPRNLFHKGEGIEMSTAIHAEAKIIANAAKNGFSTRGADLYVTTFPCPLCAKQIAEAGIAKVFYAEGYGVLNAEEILKAAGVELVKVESNVVENDNKEIKSFIKRY